ncbi:hypothetical protein [Brevibacillus laterosporus]|uniref:hypothetical protein n=1 Tax=Brevibacillus laterosporus TaxID=1465 RepID=UPI003D2445CB
MFNCTIGKYYGIIRIPDELLAVHSMRKPDLALFMPDRVKLVASDYSYKDLSTYFLLESEKKIEGITFDIIHGQSIPLAHYTIKNGNIEIGA